MAIVMTDILHPRDGADILEILAAAAAAKTPLCVEGGGSKRGLGGRGTAAKTVSLARLSGVGDYEPEELVLAAAAGTPMDEIAAALARAGQMLAFEPPDLTHLWGGAGPGTLGGVIATNLAGSRRISHGAARDHLLGFKAVSGRGEAFKSGGRMVKNVTGYDLSKLVAGSFGTLALLTEITVKTLPRPEKSRTVLIYGLDDAKAVLALAQGLGSAHDVSGAAHLPAAAAAASSVDLVSGAGAAVTALRIEGVGPSVAARCAALREILASFGPGEELHSHRSTTLWREITDARLLGTGATPVWKLSVPPSAGPGVLAACGPVATAFYDWGGGLIWLRLPESPEDGGADRVRGAAAAVGGHATLIAASADLRQRVPAFSPLDPALAALNRAIKAQFDPLGLLNPGRLWPAS